MFVSVASAFTGAQRSPISSLYHLIARDMASCNSKLSRFYGTPITDRQMNGHTTLLLLVRDMAS